MMTACVVVSFDSFKTSSVLFNPRTHMPTHEADSGFYFEWDSFKRCDSTKAETCFYFSILNFQIGNMSVIHPRYIRTVSELKKRILNYFPTLSYLLLLN